MLPDNAYLHLKTNKTEIKNLNINNNNNNIKTLVIRADLILKINLDFYKFKNKFNNLNKLHFQHIRLINVSNIHTNIKELKFYDVYWTSIKSHYFKGLINLKKLKIGSNRISTIENNTFRHLIYLLSLDLEDNRITRIEAGAFFGLKQLNRLNIRTNDLEGLNARTFNILTKRGRYEVIELRHNSLRRIKSGLFISHYIIEIDLSHNSISLIYNNTFNATKLEILFLNNNYLSSLDEGVFGNFNTNLKYFWIYSNTIRCDCPKFKWVLNHPILTHLNRSQNEYICHHCHKLNKNVGESNIINNITNNTGKYI